PATDTPISNGGGSIVRWRPDGKELFYIAPDGRLIAVPIRRLTDQNLDLGAPAPLFSTYLWGGTLNHMPAYSVSTDGQEFLMNVEPPDTTAISVILNWKAKR